MTSRIMPPVADATAPLPGPDAFRLPRGVRYLDCASHGLRLRVVDAAARAALEAAPWTLRYDDWQAARESTRTRAAALLFGGDAEGVAFVPSAAYALATAARNLPLARDDTVLVPAEHFPSDLMAWQQRCAEVGARIAVVRRDDGESWTEAVLAAIARAPRLRVVALTQAHWHDGALLDLDRIAPQVHDAGAALVLDLSQSLGVLALDLARWRPDFVAAVGYKWLLGITGLAWLWAAPRWRSEGTALEQHWLAREDDAVWRFDAERMPRHRAGARRFDAGGVAEPLPLAMADAALRQLEVWGLSRIAARLGALTGALDNALDERGLTAWKTRDHGPHFTALRPPLARLDAVEAALRAANIAHSRRGDALRIAPYLHVDAATMIQVAQIAADAGTR